MEVVSGGRGCHLLISPLSLPLFGSVCIDLRLSFSISNDTYSQIDGLLLLAASHFTLWACTTLL